MSPAERIAQHPALAEFCVQEWLSQQAATLSPEQIRAALAPETEHSCEAI
jgi:hypothetical protein